jgi:hypothetical protein
VAISGLANVYPERLSKLIKAGEDDPPIIELVNEILKFPVTPAVKGLIAHRQNQCQCQCQCQCQWAGRDFSTTNQDLKIERWVVLI